jgi:cytochrome c-type biogenesis protein CcmH/NrfG
MFKNKHYVVPVVLLLVTVTFFVMCKNTSRTILAQPEKEDSGKLIMQHFKSGEIELAIKLAKEYLASKPNDIAIINLLAEAYVNTGDFSSAEAAVNKAMAIQSDNPWSCRLLGRIYIERSKDRHVKSDELALVLKQVEKGLVSNPNDTQLLTVVAQIYLKQGNRDKANQTIDKALKINPKDNYLIKIKKGINEKEKVFKDNFNEESSGQDGGADKLP